MLLQMSGVKNMESNRNMSTLKYGTEDANLSWFSVRENMGFSNYT